MWDYWDISYIRQQNMLCIFPYLESLCIVWTIYCQTKEWESQHKTFNLKLIFYRDTHKWALNGFQHTHSLYSLTSLSLSNHLLTDFWQLDRKNLQEGIYPWITQVLPYMTSWMLPFLPLTLGLLEYVCIMGGTCEALVESSLLVSRDKYQRSTIEIFDVCE